MFAGFLHVCSVIAGVLPARREFSVFLFSVPYSSSVLCACSSSYVRETRLPSF